jgi:hypothetical protein
MTPLLRRKYIVLPPECIWLYHLFEVLQLCRVGSPFCVAFCLVCTLFTSKRSLIAFTFIISNKEWLHTDLENKWGTWNAKILPPCLHTANIAMTLKVSPSSLLERRKRVDRELGLSTHRVGCMSVVRRRRKDEQADTGCREDADILPRDRIFCIS